jgi:hypothetical protein
MRHLRWPLWSQVKFWSTWGPCQNELKTKTSTWRTSKLWHVWFVCVRYSGYALEWASYWFNPLLVVIGNFLGLI